MSIAPPVLDALDASSNTPRSRSDLLAFALPKGRMYDGVARLLAEAGMPIGAGPRGYRPRLPLEGVEAKILKPQTIVEMLALGVRDLGFAGADWVSELLPTLRSEGGLDPVEVLDTGLDPVRLVVAAPASLLCDGALPNRPLRVASEYVRLADAWALRRGCGDRTIRSWGATEVFPPDDADVVLDITQSGATLAANGLVVVEELLVSSTRLYASAAAWRDQRLRSTIETIAMLLRSVLEARGRVMLELNVDADRLREVVALLPCMREPTLSPLAGNRGFAVKAAVPRDRLAGLIPALKARGGSDLAVTALVQVTP
jgi:ATP phosphoribosyltransferase